jgi:hypothetical protein
MTEGAGRGLGSDYFFACITFAGSGLTSVWKILLFCCYLDF